MQGLVRPSERGAASFLPASRFEARLWALCAIAAAGLLGCGSPGSTSTASRTTTATSTAAVTATPSPSPTVDPTDAQIVAAYEASTSAFMHASAVPDPQDPLLAQTMTGNQLATVIVGLAKEKEKGLVGRGEIHFGQPHVVSTDGAVATLKDCRYDSSFTYALASGALDPPNQLPSYEGVTVRLVLAIGSWKVSDVATEYFQKEGTCPSGY